MTIDEAIEQFKYDAECNRVDLDLSYAEDNEQIAKWLEELKFIRQWKSDVMDSFCKYDVSSFEELIANARNKAIDDFAEKLKSECREHYIDCDPYFGGITDSILYEDDIEEIAEQLKAGEQNEQTSNIHA